MSFLADTCWFIDLEKRRPEAISFLTHHPSSTFVLCEIVRGELHAGGRDVSRVAALVGSALLATIDERVARIWGGAAGHLRETGQMIGANDLWIAAIALANDFPVLTRNASDFNRVPGLKVEAY